MDLSKLIDFKEILSNLGDVTLLVIGVLATVFSKRIKAWLEKKTNEKFEHSINKSTQVRDMLAELRALYGASRVSLWQLHNGQYYFSGEGADKLSLTHFVLGVGVAIPDGIATKLQNVPITHWVESFSRMSKEGYYYVRTEDIVDPFPAESAITNGTKSLIFGPVKDHRGHWRGILSISFAHYEDDPNVEVAAQYGKNLGALLSQS